MFASLAEGKKEDTEAIAKELHPEKPLVRIALIGVGAVSAFHHIPGIRIDPRAALVAICDSSKELLATREKEWGPVFVTSDYKEIVANPDVDAVIIATPNALHVEIAEACMRAGKHVMCEKPLGLNAKQALHLAEVAESLPNVCHMTAFTYRFAPSLRYLKTLIDSGELGQLRHFRSQRFLDWAETSWSWRQYKATAGAGNIYDMTIHRIDFAQFLMGKISSVTGKVKQFVPRDKTPEGLPCPPSEVDDWTAMIVDFENGATGVFEGSTLMKGHHNDGFGFEWAEVNGSLGTAVYQLKDPYNILIGKHGESLKTVPVPKEFVVIEGSPRDPTVGVPTTVFRYDQLYEFVSAIVGKRQTIATFRDGASAQVVADACLLASEQRRWVDVAEITSEAPQQNKDAPLKGKVAVVTGGGTGIGRGIVLSYANAGAKVYCLGRRVEPLNEVVAALKTTSGGSITPLSCDVSSSDSVKKCFDLILSSEPSLDILVNSAGINIAERQAEILTIDNYRSIMGANVDGAFFCIHSVLPQMRKQGGGLIINISSVAALRGLPLAGAAYCASKAAMNMLGSTISAEQYEHGIRVCNFCPGEVNTPIMDKRAKVPDAEARNQMLQPEDCAAAALMIACLPPRAQVSELVIKPTIQQFWT